MFERHVDGNATVADWDSSHAKCLEAVR